MDKILITGATGFIGSYLTKELIKKYKARVIVRENSDLSELNELKKQHNANLEIIYGNLLDKSSLEKAMKGIDMVIHCAALHGNYAYKQMYNANVIGTKNLLEICGQNRIKKFVYFSSATTFGKIENGDEKSARKPETDYAKTKYLGEQVCDELIKKKELPITILIPPLVYGPHKRANMIKWFKYIKKGYFMIFGDGNNKIEIVYIDDLVGAVLKVLKSKKSNNEKYIISGQTTTMDKFADAIAKAEGAKKPKHIPLLLAYAAGLFLGIISKITGKDMPINVTKVKNMSRNRSLSISKARKELGYKPKVSAEKGIIKTVKWCKANNIF